MIIAVPVSFGIAFFLTEVAPRWLRGPVGTAIELLAGIPSIIYGMWGLFVLVPVLAEHVYPWVDENLGQWPLVGALFSGPPLGLGEIGGGREGRHRHLVDGLDALFEARIGALPHRLDGAAQQQRGGQQARRERSRGTSHHAPRTHAAKASNSRLPAHWLFSGWNCTAKMPSSATAAAKSPPYSVTPAIRSGSRGTARAVTWSGTTRSAQRKERGPSPTLQSMGRAWTLMLPILPMSRPSVISRKALQLMSM